MHCTFLKRIMGRVKLDMANTFLPKVNGVMKCIRVYLNKHIIKKEEIR